MCRGAGPARPGEVGDLVVLVARLLEQGRVGQEALGGQGVLDLGEGGEGGGGTGDDDDDY